MQYSTPRSSAEPAKPLSSSLKAMLPPEIVLEILRQALISLESLAFCPLIRSKKEAQLDREKHPNTPSYMRKRLSSTLRLARLDKCDSGEPIAAQLMQTFSSLSLVSKSTRSSAREIFFGENKWFLHITPTFNAIEWIQKFWGLSVIGLMRNIRLDLQALRQPLVYALEIFVSAVDSKRLTNLEIRYLEASRPLQCARVSARTGKEIIWHFHPMLQDHGLERNCEGGRGLIIPKGEEGNYDEDDLGTKYEGSESEPEEWKVNQVVLMPLAKLRGVRKVRVEGNVTERFAVWLEGAMMAGVGMGVVEFEFGIEAKKELAMFEEGYGEL